MQIIDETGQLRNQAWLTSNFGPLTIINPPNDSHTYEITELRANTGPAAIIVKVLNPTGQPIPDIPVVWHCPTLPRSLTAAGTTPESSA